MNITKIKCYSLPVLHFKSSRHQLEQISDHRKYMFMECKPGPHFSDPGFLQHQTAGPWGLTCDNVQLGLSGICAPHFHCAKLPMAKMRQIYLLKHISAVLQSFLSV